MRRLIVGILAVLVMSACSSTAVITTTTPRTIATTTTTITAQPNPFPTTVVAANGAVEINEAPQAIVSLSPTATEMLFAIGAGGQVVACLLYTSPSPRDGLLSRMPSSA